MRILFMGTPDYAVPTLRALQAAGHEIAAVYSQPPRAAGRRGLRTTPSPVQAEAERLGLAVMTPLSLKGADEIARLSEWEAEVGVVVAYGLLLPQAALDAPRLGCLNGHASLLPRWRGAAPIQRAIEAGDTRTGVMVMGMEAGLDTGPVAKLRAYETGIGRRTTAGELHDRLSKLTAAAMVEALDRLAAGRLAFEPQVEIAARTGRDAIYANKIDKADARIEFAGRADAVAQRINAFSPFPGAWTMADFGAGPERLKLLRAKAEPGSGEPGAVLDDAFLVACGSGAVRILEGQRAGGRPMTAEALLRGARLALGARLGPG